MELYQLQTFIVVAEEQSITRAAKRLYTTPSTVSMHIKALEDELNVQLFVRTSRGMNITEKGRVLHDKARQTLWAAQDMVNHATELQAHLMGQVTIGINASPAYLRIPALLAALNEVNPGIDVQLQKASSGQMVNAMCNGEVDLGYVFGAVDDPRCEQHLLSTAQLVVAAPSAWQSDLTDADWSQLATYPWVDVGVNCPFQALIKRTFNDRNLSYQTAVKADDEQTRLQLVAAGVGLSLLEESEARAGVDEGQIVIVPVDPLPCDLSVICRIEDRKQPLIQALLRQISAVWDQTPRKTAASHPE